MIQKLTSDQRGTVLSLELVLLAVVVLIGLMTGMTSVRDAIVSEVSDLAGSVQDANQSFSVFGISGTSSSVSGMDFEDSLDFGDTAEDPSGEADNCIVMTTPPSDEVPPYVSAVFGHPTENPARFLDSWRANMVVDESQTFTSTATDPITVFAETFSFYAGRIGGIVTPFIVEVFGDNNFQVVAVGDTVAVTAGGDQTHDFTSTTTSINVDPGATLAFGFLDANADGTGSNNSVIRFDYSANEIWYSGGPGNGESGSVSVGSAPTRGNRTLTNQRRDYQFGIGLSIPE